MIEDITPALLVKFMTYETAAMRDIKNGDVLAGASDRPRQVAYSAVLARDEALLDDEITGGWKIINESLLFVLISDADVLVHIWHVGPFKSLTFK